MGNQMTKSANTERAFYLPATRRVVVHMKYILTVGLLSASSLMAAGKLSPDLSNLSPAGFVDVIIQFKEPPGIAQLAGVLASGGALKQTLPNINAALVTLPAAAVKALANNPT